MHDLRLEPLDIPSLPAIVKLHMSAFPGSAITAFGPDIVGRYYAWLIEGPHDAVVMGAWNDARLVGFCAAGLFKGAMSGFLRANRVSLARRVVARPRLVLNPLIRDRIVTALKITVRFSRLRTRAPAPSADMSRSGRPFGVLSIATDPAIRGKGAGRALMLDAERRARSLGFSQMTLTVHPTNSRAVRFYEELGWKRRVGSDGAWSGGMTRSLNGP